MPVGVIAAGDERTARVGIEILRRGGNAVDAAVAANFAAFVAEPVLTAPYGGGYASVAGPGIPPQVYDSFANAPGLSSSAPIEEIDFHKVAVDFGETSQDFHVGRGAYACSSLLPGLVGLHADHGRLPLEQIAAPAAALAEAGEPISANIEGFITVLEPILRLTPATEALFAPGGRLLRAGDPFRNPDLAGLLRRVGQGKRPVEPETMVATFGPPHGRIGSEDLANCSVFRRDPVRAVVGDCEALLNPPPSSGGTLVAFTLRLLEVLPASVWHNDTQCALHLVAAMAVCNAARVDLFDPAVQAGDDAVAERFLSDAYVDRWREPFARTVREGPESMPTGRLDPGSTTHLSVIDSDGLACGITTSNGEGCGHLVPGAGAMANNFMGEEDLHPHGFHKHPAGRRLTSMMCPTVVLRDGRPAVVLGSGGSNRIRTALMQVIVHHILRGQSIVDAVQAPRLHYEGDTLFIERRCCGVEMPTALLEALQRFAPKTVVFEAPNFFFGGVHAVDAEGNGVGDPRRGGVVRTV